jgi:hypothetical protein
VLSCVGDHILQDFNTLFLTRFRIYKIATPSPPPPKQQPSREGGPRQTDTCCKVPLQIPTFGIAFYQSNLSKDSTVKD